MPDRETGRRLDDWRAAERAEAETIRGSKAHRRAHAASRRARWAFEDASRATNRDAGAPPEQLSTSMDRALGRLREASDGAAEIGRGHDQAARQESPETHDERDKRLADDAEFGRELGSG